MHRQHFVGKSRKPVHPENRKKPAPALPTTMVARKVVQGPHVVVERNVPPPQPKATPTKCPLSPEMVLLIMLIFIPVAFSAGLYIRFVTRGPQVVVFSREPTGSTAGTDGPVATTGTGGESGGTESGEATSGETGGTSTPGSCEPSEANTTDGPDEPISQPVGHDKHKGDLPEDVKPESYDIAMNVTGATLGPAMNVTGRVETHLHVLNNTYKVVFLAKADTLKDIRVAMLRGPPSPCSKGRGLDIHSVSRDSDYLIVRLTDPLIVGRAYTLVTVHTYQPTSGGPITLKKTMGRMELESGKAHAAFPCYEKKGLLVPMKLSVIVPGNLRVIANELIDCNARRTKINAGVKGATLRKWVFEATMPMPLHKLAWAVLPPTLTAHIVVPGVVRQFAEKEDVELKEVIKRSFPYLANYFQESDNQFITKLDIVLGTQEQDSIGILLLKAPVTSKGIAMCKRIAQQWTSHLLPQYREPSWLASSGVAYLCRLALADNEDGVVAAFKEDIEKCWKNSATNDTKKLLAFRMSHISQGDRRTKKAIQKHVEDNLFKDAPAHDNTLDVFAPVLPKEKLLAFLATGYQTAKLQRSFGAQKKLTWKEPKSSPLLVATNAVSSTLKLKTPDGFNVSWLDASKPDTPLLLADDESLFMNPGVMACYGVELDNVTWALVGDKMEVETPHVLNADYLLSQASKQFANVSWPLDIAGFLWASGLLKGGDNELWNKYGKQLVASEYHAYTMLLMTFDLDKAYKKSMDGLIKKRVEAINPTKDLHPSAEPTSIAVALANVACFVGSARCADFAAGLERMVIDDGFKKNIQAITLLAPEAVACRLASLVRDDGEFKAKLKTTGLSMRLAFAACVPEKIGRRTLMRLAIDALSKNLDSEGNNVRLSCYVRDKMLDVLSLREKTPLADSMVLQTKAIMRAIKIRAIRSAYEAKTIQAASSKEPLNMPMTNEAMMALEKFGVDEYQPLNNWIHKHAARRVVLANKN